MSKAKVIGERNNAAERKRQDLVCAAFEVAEELRAANRTELENGADPLSQRIAVRRKVIQSLESMGDDV